MQLSTKRGQGENEFLKWILLMAFLIIAGGGIYFLLKSLKVF